MCLNKKWDFDLLYSAGKKKHSVTKKLWTITFNVKYVPKKNHNQSMRRIDIIETTYGTNGWSTSVNSLSIQFYVPWVTQVSHSIGRQSWFQTKQSKWLYFFAPTTMLFAPVWVSFLMKNVLFHLDWALIDHDQPLCWSDDIMCKVVHNKICTSFATTFSVGIRGNCEVRGCWFKSPRGIS